MSLFVAVDILVRVAVPKDAWYGWYAVVELDST
jgi:hypothetical protein